MTRVAVVLADGFEEIEALASVDVFRRAHFDCQIVGLDSHEVEGSHGIRVQTDQVFDGDLSSFDLIVLPGGMPGSVHLRDSESLITELQRAVASGKSVAAICAAPIVLDKAGLLDSRHYTCFPGKEKTFRQVFIWKRMWSLMVQLSLAEVLEQVWISPINWLIYLVEMGKA